MKTLLFIIFLVLTLENVSAIDMSEIASSNNLVAISEHTQESTILDTLSFENCENLGILECFGFNQINISLNEQKKLFSSLLETKNDNLHEFIYNWNTNLSFDQMSEILISEHAQEFPILDIPQSLLPESFKTIENAWLIITSIMPGVLYGNTLYNNNSGSVLSNYNYTLTKPDTYFNGNWQLCKTNLPTSNGDCRTEYPNNFDESYIDTRLNNDYLGNESLLSFNTTDSVNNFESELNIVNKIETKHFKWSKGNCCKCRRCCWSSGKKTRCGYNCNRCGCGTYTQNCGYSSTDYRYDELILTDNKSGILEWINYTSPIILFDESKSTGYFMFNSTNIDHYDLTVGDFKITKNNLEYSHNYSYIPVNVITAKANFNPEISSNAYSTFTNANNSDFIEFQFRNTSNNCTLDIYSYFNKNNLTCSITTLPKTDLNITTDKFFYLPNEIIMVNISIESTADTSNDIIQINYGNDSINTTSGMIELTAKTNTNKISAKYDTDLTHGSAIAFKTINVYSGENPKVYVTVFWIIVFFLVFATILRMCYIKFVGVTNE